MNVTVHQIKNVLVNVFLIVEPAGLSLIDSGTGSGARTILGKIAALGYQPGDLKHILITHADGDHIGGAAELKRATGARIYASALEAEAMAHGEPSRPLRTTPATKPLFELMKRVMPIAPARADEIITEGVELPIMGGLRVISTPGHTPDHVSFYAPTYGALFAGDSMNAFGGKLGFSDGPVTWDYALGQESVRKQAGLGARIVFCGHGRVLRDTDVQFPFR